MFDDDNQPWKKSGLKGRDGKGGDDDEEDDENYWNLSVRKTNSNIFSEEKNLINRRLLSKQVKSQPNALSLRKFNENVNFNKEREDVNITMPRASPATNEKSPKSLFYLNSDSNTSSKTALADSSKVVTKQSEPEISKQRADELKERRLKAEISSKEAELIYLKERRDEPPEISETIERLLLDKPYWFDLYKTKTQKVKLLDAAIKSQDGNAILAVVLFLKRTLSIDVFLNVTSTKQEALNHYIYYLEQMKDFKLLSDIYRKLGKHSDAAFNAYRPVLNSLGTDVNTKLKDLNDIKQNYTNEVSNIATKHLQLLEFQKRLEKSGSPNGIMDAISSLNRKNSEQLNLKEDFVSVYDAVTFCLKNCQKLPKGEVFTPDNFKSYFGLTSKQFSFIFIQSMAECSYWSEIDRFTIPPSQFSALGFNAKRSSDIPWEVIVNIISAAKGPQEEMKKYSRLVENAESRLNLAVKLKLHDVVIETCKQQKDKGTLIGYLNKLQINSSEYIEVNKTIKDPTIKWKS